ncbi:MAG: hypothetical protein KIT72_12740 [Polyangiaceae bacterium]|nr:hypothetical protein [Polyangiaceae bacterium]MCW5791280.1 hypothetical protein [Polyangiaceae bacterium]
MADAPPPLQRTARQFPQLCPDCGAHLPAETEVMGDCATCKAKAKENARVALARVQARQWAAELKAAQKKHARIQRRGDGPPSSAERLTEPVQQRLEGLCRVLAAQVATQDWDAARESHRTLGDLLQALGEDN